MVQSRVMETNEGIQSEVSVAQYDEMLRRLCDRGLMETKAIIKSGINGGEVLEIGPGPGYLGLEWLSMTTGTRLVGLEISPAMICKAEENAQTYGVLERVSYEEGNAMQMPFADGRFDSVFTNGSLHEWEYPEQVFDEISRVLKPGGRYWISDLKRDMSWPVRFIMKAMTRPKVIRPGLVSSINAAYTVSELRSLLDNTALSNCEIQCNPFGLEIFGAAH